MDGLYKNVENITINEDEPLVVEDLDYLRYVADLLNNNTYQMYCFKKKKKLKCLIDHILPSFNNLLFFKRFKKLSTMDCH
jgi:hypothetical protein